MEVKIFLAPELKKGLTDTQIAQLVSMFREYKVTNVPPKNWGRDVPFDLVTSIRESGLAHIHVKDNTSKNWHLQRLQFNKTSDTYLVYCQGYFDKNKYLLIALYDNAHAISRENLLYVMRLADIANGFRNKY